MAVRSRSSQAEMGIPTGNYRGSVRANGGTRCAHLRRRLLQEGRLLFIGQVCQRSVEYRFDLTETGRSARRRAVVAAGGHTNRCALLHVRVPADNADDRRVAGPRRQLTRHGEIRRLVPALRAREVPQEMGQFRREGRDLHLQLDVAAIAHRDVVAAATTIAEQSQFQTVIAARRTRGLGQHDTGIREVLNRAHRSPPAGVMRRGAPDSSEICAAGLDPPVSPGYLRAFHTHTAS